jgi:hypothetical protein
VSDEIVFIDSYLCPHCRTELEAGPHRWLGWLRCPTCGRPSLPPGPLPYPYARRPAARPSRPSGVLFISESGSRTISTDPESGTEVETGAPSRFSPARLVITTGLALCLFMALVAYLDRNTVNMAIFGFLSLVFFVMLLRTSPRGRAST